jgi:hypothetical protein
MGLIIQKVDLIREKSQTNFLLIHHTGKSQTAGARGWSGIRAAVDTEIEVTAVKDSGRCAEITKQRDMPTKGKRIGFDLETVQLGLNKWGEPSTSCIVLSAIAPSKSRSMKLGELDGAILEFLRSKGVGVGIRIHMVFDHFSKDRNHHRTTIKRHIDKLVDLGLLNFSIGMVSYSTNNI